MTPRRTWIALALVWIAFFSWYTSFTGPLTPEEIAHNLAVLEERGADPARVAAFRQFMEADTGDDFVMLNAIDLREVPQAVPGVEPGETSEEVLARYTTPFLGRALRGAAHPVLVGRASGPAVDLWGIKGAERWDQGGIVRYRSRRDLMEQALALGPTGLHAFKTAAIEKTIAFPLDPWFQLGDPRLVLALVLVNLGLANHLRCALSARAPHAR